MKLPAAPIFKETDSAMLKHFAKCEKMLRENFIDKPFMGDISREKVKAALDKKDYHLNTISLDRWDNISGYTQKRMVQPMTGGTFYYSDILCALKHYARFYYINE